MSDEARATRETGGASDPEPLAIVAVCVAAFAMLGTVANACINYRKYARDEVERIEDISAEFFAGADRLRARGDRLLSVIRTAGEYAQEAFALAHTARGLAGDDEPRARTLRAGDTSIDLSSSARKRWT